MAKLSIVTYKPQKNGTIAIAIRLSHKTERKFFPYSVVEKSSIGKNGKITNAKLNAQVMLDLSTYNLRLAEIDTIVNTLGIDQVYNHVFGIMEEVVETDDSLDFIKWYNEVIEDKKKVGGRTYETYRSSLSNLIRYIGKDSIDINELTKSFWIGYMDWFDNNDFGRRAKEQYMVNHRAVHNAARLKFNDEEIGRIVVKYHPFEGLKFKMTKAEKDEIKRVRGERCISSTAVRYLYEAPEHPTKARANFARDMFILSYCLCGVNACDLMEMKSLNKQGCVEFWRKKTRRRSGDSSHIIIPVHDIIEPILNKYRGTDRLLNLSKRYSTENNLNTALNEGLRDMVRWMVEYYSAIWNCSESETINKLEMPDDLDLQFGFARHAFSTTAKRHCGVSIDDIDQCLCHSIDSVAVKEYIGRDYDFVKRVVDGVIGYTFGK